jgi:hypothetical protein
MTIRRSVATLTRHGRRVAELREQRVQVDGRWVSIAPDCPHGDRRGYSYWSCHCDACGAAERQYRDSLKAQPIPPELHGTAAGRNRGCDQDCCVTAAREYDHDRYVEQGPRWSRVQAEQRAK